MSDRQKEAIIQKVQEAVPGLTDFQLGYMLGLAEANVKEGDKECREEK